MNLLNSILSFLSSLGLFLTAYYLGNKLNLKLLYSQGKSQISRPSKAVFNTASGLALIIILLQHIGLIGWLYKDFFVFCSYAFIIVSLAYIGHLLIGIKRWLPESIKSIWNITLADLLLLSLISGILLSMTLAASFPEIYSDALRCHLKLPQRWLESHHLFFVPDNILFSALPLNQGLLNLFAVSSLGGPMAHFMNLFFLLGCLLGVYELTVHFSEDKHPPTKALISVLCILTIPTVYFCTISAMSDIGALFFCYAACLVAANRGSGLKPMGWLLLGLYSGIAVGIKPNTIVIAGLVCLIICFRQNLKTIPKFCLLCGLAIVASTYVYPLRALLEVGNPIWPKGAELFGDPYAAFTAHRAELFYADPRLDNSILSYLRICYKYFIHLFKFDTLSFHYLITLPLGYVAVIVSCLKKNRNDTDKLAIIVFTSSLILSYLSFIYISDNPRKQLMPALFILTPFIVLYCSKYRIIKILSSAAICFFLVSYLYLISGPAKANLKDAIQNYPKSDSWTDYLLKKKSTYPMALYINNELDDTSKILSWATKLNYYIKKPAYNANPYYSFGLFSHDNTQSLSEYADYLRNTHGITHLLLYKGKREQDLASDTLRSMKQLAAAHGKKIHEIDRGRKLALYELHAPP